jgi:hypothetical protein
MVDPLAPQHASGNSKNMDEIKHPKPRNGISPDTEFFSKIQSIF